MKYKNRQILSGIMMATAVIAPSVTMQAEKTDSVQKKPFISRLSLGGYGDATYSWNFYSDNVNRYSHAADYKDAKGHA